MKKIQKNYKIISISRENNSIYGNPKWSVLLEDKNGNLTNAKTATNASVGYFLGYSSEGKTYNITGHYTKNNNFIIDYAN